MEEICVSSSFTIGAGKSRAMEELIKEQQSTPLPGNLARPKLLRYALRSGTKSKEEKVAPELSNSLSFASKRSKTVSSVSQSVEVLDLSAKDKSAKPPRRMSIPTKSASPSPNLLDNITPISEVRRTARSLGKSDTPGSSRITFNILSSTSYWLSQIKLSKAASKHSVSLGFFRLALEAGCKMHDELKAYIDRCNLDENDQTLKDLLERYNTPEDTEQLQVSETFSQGPEVGTRSSDDEVHSSSSTVEPTKLNPKSSNTDVHKTTPVTEVNQRNHAPTPRNRGLWNKNAAAPNSTSETAKKSVKKPHKPNKQEPIQGKDKAKKQGKKQFSEKVPASKSSEDDLVQSNKENFGGSPN